MLIMCVCVCVHYFMQMYNLLYVVYEEPQCMSYFMCGSPHTRTHINLALFLFHSLRRPEEDNARLLDFNSHLLVQDLLLYRFHTAGRSAST